MDGLDNGLYAVGGGGVVWLAQAIWTKVFSTDGKANDALVTQLSDRLASLEARQEKLEAALDDERSQRRKAQEKVHALEMDNQQLRLVLAQHNITVPPSNVISDPTPEPTL